MYSICGPSRQKSEQSRRRQNYLGKPDSSLTIPALNLPEIQVFWPDGQMFTWLFSVLKLEKVEDLMPTQWLLCRLGNSPVNYSFNIYIRWEKQRASNKQPRNVNKDFGVSTPVLRICIILIRIRIQELKNFVTDPDPGKNFTDPESGFR